MKTIYQAIDKTWSDTEPTEDWLLNAVEVDDAVLLKVLNQDAYNADGFDQATYDTALVQYNVRQAVAYLQMTDYVITQWREEEELEIEHHRTLEEYQDVLQQRQTARETIRNSGSDA